MGNIIKEMGYQTPDGRPGLPVFLPAFMTIPAYDFRATIQANLFFPFFVMRHLKKFN
jgi:hypothetical protein